MVARSDRQPPPESPIGLPEPASLELDLAQTERKPGQLLAAEVGVLPSRVGRGREEGSSPIQVTGDLLPARQAGRDRERPVGLETTENDSSRVVVTQLEVNLT